MFLLGLAVSVVSLIAFVVVLSIGSHLLDQNNSSRSGDERIKMMREKEIDKEDKKEKLNKNIKKKRLRAMVQLFCLYLNLKKIKKNGKSIRLLSQT